MFAPLLMALMSLGLTAESSADRLAYQRPQTLPLAPIARQYLKRTVAVLRAAGLAPSAAEIDGILREITTNRTPAESESYLEDVLNALDGESSRFANSSADRSTYRTTSTDEGAAAAFRRSAALNILRVGLALRQAHAGGHTGLGTLKDLVAARLAYGFGELVHRLAYGVDTPLYALANTFEFIGEVTMILIFPGIFFIVASVSVVALRFILEKLNPFSEFNGHMDNSLLTRTPLLHRLAANLHTAETARERALTGPSVYADEIPLPAHLDANTLAQTIRVRVDELLISEECESDLTPDEEAPAHLERSSR